MSRIFGESELRNYLEQIKESLKDEVDKEERNKLLNVNEVEYVQYLVGKHRLDPIEFHVDQLALSEREEQIRARNY